MQKAGFPHLARCAQWKAVWARNAPSSSKTLPQNGRHIRLLARARDHLAGDVLEPFGDVDRDVETIERVIWKKAEWEHELAREAFVGVVGSRATKLLEVVLPGADDP